MNGGVLLLLIAAATTVLSNRIPKEQWKTSAIPQGWQRVGRVNPADRINLLVFIKQQNLGELERKFFAVSDPQNPEYGQHLTMQQVNALVAPKPSSILKVLGWLQEHGIDLKRQVKHNSHSDTLKVETDFRTAERLLHTEYHNYKHVSGARIARVPSYSLPAEVHDEIDMVGPTIRFPAISSVRVRPRLLGKTSSSEPNFGVDPTFLRKIYNIPTEVISRNPNNRVGVASFLGQFFSPSDLQSFFQQFNPEASGRQTTVMGPNTPSNPGVEAMLDIEYQMSIGNNVTSQFWSTPGQQPRNPENEPFLDWLYNVGNDTNAPWVFSISYGDNEDTVWYDYAVRVNQEFIKGGTRGISFMASSGDGGVGGSQPTECTKFIPTYPAGSPYVLAVGGSTSSSPEVAAGLSSGGFSNRWARPSYQDSFITQYFKVAQNLPDPSLYNHTGAGFPDVAAQAEGFNIVVNGFAQQVDGTSCSSPTFSGVVALLNEIRLNNGKSPLGFLPPLFYQNPSAFNDITSGNNPGCNTNGFQAAVGWDPVTGLGSPDYGKLAKIVDSLP